MKICLFQPEIPGNFGNIMRTLVCFGIDSLDVIMPMGFNLDSRDVTRVAMDYGKSISVNKFQNFQSYKDENPDARFVLSTTKTDRSFRKFEYQDRDIIVFGSESSGASKDIEECSEKITIPIQSDARSLNLAISVGIVVQYAVDYLNEKNC